MARAGGIWPPFFFFFLSIESILYFAVLGTVTSDSVGWMSPSECAAALKHEVHCIVTPLGGLEWLNVLIFLNKNFWVLTQDAATFLLAVCPIRSSFMHLWCPIS